MLNVNNAPSPLFALFSPPPGKGAGDKKNDLLATLRDMADAEPLNLEPRKVLLAAYVEAGEMSPARALACDMLDFPGIDDETRALCGSVLEIDTLDVFSAGSVEAQTVVIEPTADPTPGTPVNALAKPKPPMRRGKRVADRDPEAPSASELATVASMQQDADGLRAEAEQLVQRGELLKSILPADTTLTTKLGRLRRLLGSSP
jgi:hypothetical protein